MGAVEKGKELGYIEGCTGYYLCLISLLLALLIIPCFTEITSNNFSAYNEHGMKLTAAAQQELEKAGEQSWSKAGR